MKIIDVLESKAFKAATNDGAYVVFIVLFAVGASYFDTSSAPQHLSRTQQVLYFDVSAMFQKSKNPDPRSYRVVIAAFVMLGVLKLCSSFTFVAKGCRGQRRWWSFGFRMSQGITLMLDALCNGDVNYDAHVTWAAITTVSTVVLDFAHVFSINRFTKLAKTVMSHVVFVSAGCCITIQILYIILSKSVAEPLHCGKYCYAAPAMSGGYTEYATLLWIFALDLILTTYSFELFFKKIGWLEPEPSSRASVQMQGATCQDPAQKA